MGLYLNSLAYINADKAQLAAFGLFCRPLRTAISEKQRIFFNSAEKFTLENDDATVQVYKWGTGSKKIVFLHGWQSHSYRWKTYIDALNKEDYTIYAMDAPGHGLSSGKFLTVPVYGALIHQLILELGEVHTIVGHSLGGFSLLYSFHQNPLLPVSKLILMAPPGEASDFLEFYKKTLGLSEKVIELVVDRFRQLYNVTPDYFSSKRFASSVNLPGLIIHDEGDTEAPYQYSINIHKEWKRSKLISSRGLGHNLKSPTIVSEVVNYIEGSHEGRETPFSESSRATIHLNS